MLGLLSLDRPLSLEHTLPFPLQSASLLAPRISLLCELTSPMEPQLTELIGLWVQPPKTSQCTLSGFHPLSTVPCASVGVHSSLSLMCLFTLCRPLTLPPFLLSGPYPLPVPCCSFQPTSSKTTLPPSAGCLITLIINQRPIRVPTICPPLDPWFLCL